MPLDEVKELGLSYSEKDIKEVHFDYKNGKELKEPCLIVKGIRTKYYPPHFKILRKSRELDKPVVDEMRYYEARKKVDYRKPTYCDTLQIIDDENNWSNIIKTEEYNLNRDIIDVTSEDEKMINRKRRKAEKERKLNKKPVIENDTFNI